MIDLSATWKVDTWVRLVKSHLSATWQVDTWQDDTQVRLDKSKLKWSTWHSTWVALKFLATCEVFPSRTWVRLGKNLVDRDVHLIALRSRPKRCHICWVLDFRVFLIFVDVVRSRLCGYDDLRLIHVTNFLLGLTVKVQIYGGKVVYMPGNVHINSSSTNSWFGWASRAT